VGYSWRVDETHLKVRGRWVCLYRAVDKQGKTIESYLSRTRDITAAKAFFRKAFRRHGDPRVITLDAFEPTHAALRRMGMKTSSIIVGPVGSGARSSIWLSCRWTQRSHS
jgi:transposase-like protein